MYRYTFDYADIKQQFIDFMYKLGVQPYDEREVIIDGELHRYRVHDDKSNHKSGALRIFPEGLPAGFVQDWRRGIKENWHIDTSGLGEEQRTYFDSDDFRKKAEEDRRKANEKRKQKQLEQTERARIFWESLPPAPDNHAYLLRKKIKNYGLRFDKETKDLAVPLRDISGRVQSIQWIPADSGKSKMFYPGASLDGAFWSIALAALDKDSEGIILLGEGCATMSKVFELTSRPCAAAMSCFKLKETAKILHEAYPKCKIVMIADNDWETEQEREYNPGIRGAQAVVQAKLAVDVIYPKFAPTDKGLTDWDDFAIQYGEAKAASLLQKQITWACMSEADRKEYNSRKVLEVVVHNLDPTVKLDPQEFIGGIFPRKFVSLLIAPPGTGKTIFTQKFCSDISMGGSVFDGFVDDEPERKALILAGEAGYELLTRRAASMKWAIKPQNVKVFDQYEAETKDINTMLDTREGMKNAERLINMYEPDIIFIDTFSSFHESDENKANEMKPIFKELAGFARRYNMAVVPVHHSRKRAAKERGLQLTQDDVIGSSILNRLVGLIIGIEPMKDNENVLLVQSLKSWFAKFSPFTYTLKQGLYGGTVVETDLAPAGVNNSKANVWLYLSLNFKPGEWFSASQIILSEIDGNVADWQLRRILADFVKTGKLERRGAKKSLEYSIINA